MPSRLACVYCGDQATTKDHVIPRCLLEKPYPPNLLTVPSCRNCNKGFSQDEEYFLAVLAQIGAVDSLAIKADEGGVVDRMLTRSIGLDTHILESIGISEDARVFMAPDEKRIANVARKVAFGLYCHRYRLRHAPDIDTFLSLRPTQDGGVLQLMTIDGRFRSKRWQHAQTLILADGSKTQIFDYLFVRSRVGEDRSQLYCIMRFHETIWSAVQCPAPSVVRARERRIGAPMPEAQGQFGF